MSYSNCYFVNGGWEARGNGALLKIQAKLRLEIIPISESEASDKTNKGKRKLNIRKSRKVRYDSLEKIVVFKL